MPDTRIRRQRVGVDLKKILESFFLFWSLLEPSKVILRQALVEWVT